MRAPAILAFSTLALASCGNGGEDSYRQATVIKMAAVFTPDNLSDDPDCRAQWRTVESLGVAMDESRKDWNQVLLRAAFDLIEQGCVKAVGGGGQETVAGMERKRRNFDTARRVLQSGLEPARDSAGQIIRDASGQPLRPIDALTTSYFHASLTDLPLGSIFGAGGTLGLPPWAPSVAYRARQGDVLAQRCLEFIGSLSAAMDDLHEVFPVDREGRRDMLPNTSDTRAAAPNKIKLLQDLLRGQAEIWLQEP